MKKWEDKKDFIFSHFCLVESRKVEAWKKMSLNKFTHILLLKNYAKLKKNVTNNHTHKKKSNHPNLLKNKNNIPKKEEARLLPEKKKERKKEARQALENQKKQKE